MKSQRVSVLCLTCFHFQGYYIFYYINGTDSAQAAKLEVNETEQTEISQSVTGLTSGVSYVFFVTTKGNAARASNSIHVTTGKPSIAKRTVT